MMSDYAREHVLLCLIPAFFIAGAISVFISQQSVMKYSWCRAEKWIAYSVASVSGTVLPSAHAQSSLSLRVSTKRCRTGPAYRIFILRACNKCP